MRLIVNKNPKELSVERATELVSDFCLFDGSYKKYDCAGDLKKSWEKALDFAYQIKARSPEKREELVRRLKEEIRWEDINELKTKKLHSIKDYEKIRNLFKRHIKGMGTSFKSKIFHRCLPELVPIIDNECICKIYGRRKDIIKYIAQISEDVKDSKSFLEAVQAKLKKRKIKELTILRIFDIILWALYKEGSLKKKIL